LICVTWPIDMCDMTHWYVWHDSLIRVTWLIDTCDMTHWYVWHDSLICVTWLIDMCDMTHWYVWQDMREMWFICDVWRIIRDIPFECHTSWLMLPPNVCWSMYIPPPGVSFRLAGQKFGHQAWDETNPQKKARRNWSEGTKNNENFDWKSGESKNSCRVSVGGVGVEGTMTLDKFGEIVWDWRTA